MEKMLEKRLAQARKPKNLTQEKLVELCNLSVSTIRRIETGTGATPLKTLVNICCELGIGLAYLLFDSLENKKQFETPVMQEILTLLEPLDEKKPAVFLRFS